MKNTKIIILIAIAITIMITLITLSAILSYIWASKSKNIVKPNNTQSTKLHPSITPTPKSTPKPTIISKLGINLIPDDSAVKISSTSSHKTMIISESGEVIDPDAYPTVYTSPTPTQIPPTPTFIKVKKETTADDEYNAMTKKINFVMGNIICYEPFVVQGTGIGLDTFLNNGSTTRYIVIDPENGRRSGGFYYGTHQILNKETVIEETEFGNKIKISYMTMGKVPKEWRERHNTIKK